MCYSTRTVYTVCAHHVDTPNLPCKGVSLRRRLGFTLRKVQPCCLPVNAGRAFLKLGWCPACELHLDNADCFRHHRKIPKDDWAVISNFWAWRSWHSPHGTTEVSSTQIPLAAIDQPLGAIEYRRSEEAINEVYRTYAHVVLSITSSDDWLARNKLSFFKTVDTEGPIPQVPVLGESNIHLIPDYPWIIRLPRAVPHLINFENYAVWWKIFEFQPTMIIPEELAVNYGAIPADHAVKAELLIDQVRSLTYSGYSDKNTRPGPGPRQR